MLEVAAYRALARTLIPLLALPLVASCSDSGLEICGPEGSAPCRLSMKEYAVFSALVTDRFAEEDLLGPIVVRDSTTAYDLSPWEDRNPGYFQGHMPELMDETLANFRFLNAERYGLSEQFAADLPVVLMSRDDLREVFRAGGWAEFYRRYPGSPGIVYLSRAGFNAAGTQALVAIDRSADLLSGEGYIVLLTQFRGSWSVSDAVPLSIS